MLYSLTIFWGYRKLPEYLPKGNYSRYKVLCKLHRKEQIIHWKNTFSWRQVDVSLIKEHFRFCSNFLFLTMFQFSNPFYLLLFNFFLQMKEEKGLSRLQYSVHFVVFLKIIQDFQFFLVYLELFQTLCPCLSSILWW